MLRKVVKVVLFRLSCSGLLEVDSAEDGKVRRNPAQPLPENTEETKKLVEAKTAYAKG